MKRENIHILLDMDGVLANFVGGCETVWDCDLSEIDNWGFWNHIGISKTEFWNTIQQDPRFWAELEPYPWTRDLVNLCLEKTKGNVTIVTSPDMAVGTYTQKAYWVGKHFPALMRKLFIGPEKHLMAKRGHILIDDSDQNIEKFKTHGGGAITFPQKWNKEGFNFFESDIDPINYVDEHLELRIQTLCNN